MSFEPKFMSTAIGSMPYDNADHAAEVSLKYLGAPHWPQMSRFGQLEQMETQYCENIPCAVIDKEKNRLYFDTSIDYSEIFAEFYENYMAALDEGGNGDCSALAITEPHSAGIYALERALQKKGSKVPWVKLQTIGPCSFALSITDENKRALYYNDEFKDVITKAMSMKSVWQINKFKPYAENIICFVDEPVFSGFGSSTYVSVDRQDCINTLGEVVDQVHTAGALAGCHCCGNTEWSMLVDAGIDIVNFDSFAFGETIAIYPEHVKRLLDKGGYLCWGAVPTSRIIREQTVESLEKQLEAMMENLSKAAGISKDLIAARAFLSPACGTGSLEVEEADMIYSMLSELSAKMKQKYGF